VLKKPPLLFPKCVRFFCWKTDFVCADLSVEQGVKLSYTLASDHFTIDQLAAIASSSASAFADLLTKQIGISSNQLVVTSIAIVGNGVVFKGSLLNSSAVGALTSLLTDTPFYFPIGSTFILGDRNAFSLSTCESNCAMATGECVTAHGCRLCNAGYVPNVFTGDCELCEAGSFANGTTCVPCAANTYDSDSNSATECAVCAADTTSAVGSLSCSPCKFGTHRGVANSSCSSGLFDLSLIFWLFCLFCLIRLMCLLCSGLLPCDLHARHMFWSRPMLVLQWLSRHIVL
jgi:hypothetical protein